MRTPAFTVINLGCKVNRVESDAICGKLMDAGASAHALEGTDLVIINTCTVTGEAQSKARHAVRHALGKAGDVPVIVTGCAVAIDPQGFAGISEKVICEADKNAVPALAADILGVQIDDGAHASHVGGPFRSRAGIKVQDGCDRACTYCIVHVARGPLWSKPSVDVISEVRSAQSVGLQEVVLSGIDLGNYHSDLGLTGLLRALLDSTEDVRFRLSSIEPTEVDSELIGLIAASDGRICRHLHLPLQSGSERTLEQMGRLYSADRYLTLCDSIRGAIPSISLTTDVIAGFPGETDDDFADTMALCEEVGFSKMHVFRYSRRAGTPAASRDDQVDPRVIASRAERLRGLAGRMREEFARGLIGTRESILIEEGGRATSESYFDATVPERSSTGGLPRSGTLLSVHVRDVDGDRLICDATD